MSKTHREHIEKTQRVETHQVFLGDRNHPFCKKQVQKSMRQDAVHNVNNQTVAKNVNVVINMSTVNNVNVMNNVNVVNNAKNVNAVYSVHNVHNVNTINNVNIVNNVNVAKNLNTVNNVTTYLLDGNLQAGRFVVELSADVNIG